MVQKEKKKVGAEASTLTKYKFTCMAFSFFAEQEPGPVEGEHENKAPVRSSVCLWVHVLSLGTSSREYVTTTLHCLPKKLRSFLDASRFKH